MPSPADRAYAVARFSHLGDTQPRKDLWTVDQLVLALSRFAHRAEKGGPLWSPTLYAPGSTRGLEGVREVSCLVLDFDRGHAPDDLLDHWRERGLLFIVHSTYNHTADLPKWRAVFPLKAPVPASDWEAVYARLVRRLAEGLADPACKDASRMYYLPSCPPGGTRFSESFEGEPLDPAETLEDVVGEDDPREPEPVRAPRPKPEGKETPGDWYERTQEWRPLLEFAGGAFVRQAGRREEWRRPGKKKDVSATTGNGRSEQDLLKVHTSNWPPFEAGGVYTRFGAFALLHHGGDFAAAVLAIKAMPDFPRDDEGGAPVRREYPPKPGTPLQTSAAKPPPLPEAAFDVPVWERYRKTDLGNAERLVDTFGEELRYCAKAGGWFVWDGTRWAFDEAGQATWRMTRIARDIHQEAVRCSDLEEQKRLFKHADESESAGGLSSALRVAQALPGVSVPVEAFDRDPWLLNCENGVVDLRTGKLLPHDPKHMMTRMAAAPYLPDADCPRWLEFLEQSAPDPEVQRFLWRYAGYTLTGVDREQCLVFLHGEGKNGKSTLVNALAHVVGDYARTIEIETLMAKNGEISAGQLSTIAELVNKRFVLSSEPQEGARFDESLIKRLTGGEPMVAKFMGKNTFQFQPLFKVWISGNHKPKIKGTDEGIWRRMRLVPFLHSVPKEQRDQTLPDRLKEEAAGILRWMVMGCLEWQREGLGEPDAIRQATDEYRAESDTIGLFLDARTQLNPTVTLDMDRLYKVYVAWCEVGHFRAIDRSWFGRKLKRAGKDRGFEAGERDTATNLSVVKGLEIVDAQAGEVYRGGE